MQLSSEQLPEEGVCRGRPKKSVKRLSVENADISLVAACRRRVTALPNPSVETTER